MISKKEILNSIKGKKIRLQINNDFIHITPYAQKFDKVYEIIIDIGDDIFSVEYHSIPSDPLLDHKTFYCIDKIISISANI